MNKELIIPIILSIIGIIGINYLYIDYLTKHNKIRTLKIIRAIFLIIPIIVTLLIIVGYPIYDYLQGTWGTGFIDFGIFIGTVIFLYLFVNGGWLFYLLCSLNIVFITTRLVKLYPSPDLDMETIIIPTTKITTKIISKVKERKKYKPLNQEDKTND